MEPLESILHVLGRDRAQVSHILVGGAGKLSVVPRPQTTCPVLHAQLRSVGLIAWGLACCVTLSKSSGFVAARREGHMPATHIFHKNPCFWPPVCQSLFCLPSLASKSSLQVHRRHLHLVSRFWVGQRNGEKGRGLHAPSGSELSAGAQVPTSPGIPSVSEEAQGSCRCICACSRGLSERA